MLVLGKKKKLEAKMDMQVINLDAIKQVASIEKKVKKKKNMTLLFLFLGIFMIVMGILYPIIMDTFVGNPTDISSAEKTKIKDSSVTDTKQTNDSETLTCMQVDEDSNNIKSVKDVYEFSGTGLVKFTTTTILTAQTEAGKTRILESVNTFNTLYGSIEATGVLKNINITDDNSNLTTDFSVDYRQFDLVEYNKLHTDIPLFVTYEKNTSKEEIKKAMTAQGVSCE